MQIASARLKRNLSANENTLANLGQAFITQTCLLICFIGLLEYVQLMSCGMSAVFANTVDVMFIIGRLPKKSAVVYVVYT